MCCDRVTRKDATPRTARNTRPVLGCLAAKCVYSVGMEATLTKLRRETAKVVRPATHDGQEVTITEYGEPKFKVVPVKPLDRRAACEALMAIGPVTFRPRK